MSYKDLPLDQRMELASQYALLLVADNKPTEEIIRTLKWDYALTEEQATQAFAAMRSNYKSEYNSTVRSNIIKTLGVIGVSLFAFLSYYFMGKEMGRSGTFFIIIAMVFGLGALGALIVAGRTIWEKFSNPTKPAPISGKIARKQDEIDKVIQGLTFISFMLLCFSAYQYFSRSNIIDVNKVTTVENCIITEPVRRESTGGKNPSHYYRLKLRGHNLDFRFFDNYYRYSNKAWLVSELKEWDTVSIQIFTDYQQFFDYQYSTGNLDLINLGRNGRFLVDHGYRNAAIKKSNKTNFYVLLDVFAGVLLISIFKNLYHNVKYRRQTIR
jgi:hypothetical protein